MYNFCDTMCAGEYCKFLGLSIFYFRLCHMLYLCMYVCMNGLYEISLFQTQIGNPVIMAEAFWDEDWQPNIPAPYVPEPVMWQMSYFTHQTNHQECWMCPYDRCHSGYVNQNDPLRQKENTHLVRCYRKHLVKKCILRE